MNRILISAVLAAGLVVGCKSMDKHEETTETPIAMSELPLAVSNGFNKDHPGVAPSKVEKETYKDGTVHYEFEFKDAAGKEQKAEYNIAGDKLDAH